MRLPTFLLLFIGAVCIAKGQQYENSAGVRLGSTSGLTLKKFVADEEAFEIMVSGRREGLQMTGMYVFHLPMEIAFNQNFFAYYGVGMHLGFERYNQINKVLITVDPPDFIYESRMYYVMGIDGLLGVEYRWLSVPITIAFDIKPYFSYVGFKNTNAVFWDSALSIKYIF